VHSDTYRNGMLTAIALLLAVLAWTNVSEQSMFISEAHAQIRSKPTGTARYPVALQEDEQGVSSLGQRAVVQRDELIAAVVSLRSSVDAIAARLERGDLQVKVIDQDDAAPKRPRGGDSR
jgi:hypothetical protein